MKVYLLEELLSVEEESKVYVCLYDLKNAYKVKDVLSKNDYLQIIIPAECRKCKKMSRVDILKFSKNGIYKDIFDNVIYFGDSIPEKVYISFEGANSSVVLDDNLRIDNVLNINPGTNAKIHLKSDTSFVSASMYISNGKLEIGRDCLFSSGVTIRNHDGHHIFDLTNKIRVNNEKDIIIGEHCWIGHNATILKGITIGDGSIVGEQSVVTHSCGKNVVIAGNPAKKIKENIYWKRDLTNVYSFKEDK